MGNWSTKQGHDPVSRELVDGSLVFVDLIHQDLKASVHDLVDFLRIELF